MRKFLFFSIAFIAMNVNVLGQQIQDGGFDNCWELKDPKNGKPKFWDFKKSYFFISLNATLYTLSPEMGNAPLIAFKDSSDVYDGKYALKLVSNTMQTPFAAPKDIVFLPGAMGNINIDVLSVKCDLGTAFKFRPDTIKGYFKYVPVKGDSASVEIQLQKADKKTILGHGKAVIKGTYTEWTPFSVPVVYTSNATPDEIAIIFSASAAYDFTNIDSLFNCKGQIGSALYLDEVKLTYAAGNGIEELFDPAVKLSIYPNPATEKLNLQIAKQTNGTVVIYDYLTRKMGEYSINGSQIDIDIHNFASGSYLINVIENNRVVSSGRFLKE